VVNVGNVREFGRTEVSVELRSRVEDLSLWGFSVGGENRFGNLLVDYQAGYSFADEDTPVELTLGYVFDDVTQVAFTRGRSENPEFSYTGVGRDPSDARVYEFDNATEQVALAEEEHWEFALNARQDFELSLPAFLKAGMRARLKEKRDQVEFFSSDDHPAEVATLDLVTSGLGEFNLSRRLPVIESSIQDLYFARRADFAPVRDVVQSTARDWQSSEDVVAAYAMGGLTAGKLGLSAGLRVERTRFETDGTEVDDATGTSAPLHATRTQEQWLPGVFVRYAATDRLFLRASYTETLARPGFRQSAASATVDGDEIETGNPGLVEVNSRNWDVSADYYLPGTLGVLSAAAFAKDIDNFIFSRVFPAEIDGEVYEISSYANGEKGRLRGIEMGFQRQLTFLPAPFNSFGVYGNLALIDSEATLPPGIDRDNPADLIISYPRQSDLVGNVGATFEKGRFFARVAGTFRSDYLEEVGNDRLEDIHMQGHMQWDVTTRLRLNDRWTVFANWLNANNEPLVERYGGSGRLTRFESYSWSAQMGIKYSR
jgi:TonB-dependent receptor